MIYTVTLNPSVDYIVEVKDFQLGNLHRVDREEKFPGGKGINVSRVLTRMHIPTKALGFIGGFTGRFIEKTLQDEGIEVEFISVEGPSRINIKLKSGVETEINGNGPNVTDEHLHVFFQQIETIQAGNLLVVAGSIPPNLPSNLYETIVKMCKEKGIKVVVDASGQALTQAIVHRPFLIKPNQHELAELFQTQIDTIAEAILYGKKLIEMGSENVIVSMGALGAILCTKEYVLVATIPQGNVVNSVGAGDSLVAGFIGTYARTRNIKEAFRVGVAAGTATAFSVDLCTDEKIQEIVDQVVVMEIQD
jgi:1-phosphofructokinase